MSAEVESSYSRLYFLLVEECVKSKKLDILAVCGLTFIMTAPQLTLNRGAS